MGKEKRAKLSAVGSAGEAKGQDTPSPKTVEQVSTIASRLVDEIKKEKMAGIIITLSPEGLVAYCYGDMTSGRAVDLLNQIKEEIKKKI